MSGASEMLDAALDPPRWIWATIDSPTLRTQRDAYRAWVADGEFSGTTADELTGIADDIDDELARRRAARSCARCGFEFVSFLALDNHRCGADR